VYETWGRGGFLVHPRVDGLPAEFPEGPDFPRGDMEALAAQIDRWAGDDEDRERVRARCFAACPTYDDRVAELLRLAAAICPRAADSNKGSVGRL